MPIPAITWKEMIALFEGVGVRMGETSRGHAVLFRQSQGETYMCPIPRLDLQVTPRLFSEICQALNIDPEKFLRFVERKGMGDP